MHEVDVIAFCSKKIEDEDLIQKLSTSISFEESVEILDLDKSCDFRFSNLSGLDFTGSDLRGFDFTGANLENCTGVCIKIDETTIFQGATCENSTFERYQFLEHMRHPESGFLDYYEQVKSKDWHDLSIWIGSVFNDGQFPVQVGGMKIRELRKIFCKEIFFDEIDVVGRNTMSLYSKEIFEDKLELKKSLIERMGQYNIEKSLFNTLINLSMRNFSSDILVFSTILKIAKFGKNILTESCMKFIVKSPLFDSQYDGVRSAFFSPDFESLRKELFFRSALNLGRSHLKATLLTEDLTDRNSAISWIDKPNSAPFRGDIERRQEVILNNDILRRFYQRENSLEFEFALKRVEMNKKAQLQSLERKVRTSYRSSRF